ncbi:MBL fold metallo-hydrolase [Citrobacter sp. JGM124]|uniref:MBL fold metallo-hydrolase n=1 Tax=Citrobacter sp. JGM124 TaxID=2799789 RepID=UPI001BA630CC|nr:MBL fold metallo-hydrolase [Citrobacter sp. JGM124]MBS0847328.1 MBL fold metallo-hydrolase [Citrobacter sp. JGM124]
MLDAVAPLYAHDPSFISRQVGDFLITALSDGDMAASLELLSGIEISDAGDIQRSNGITEPDNIHINCYLIRGRGRVILVDTGTGGLNGAGGLLLENLKQLGISPADIDTLLLTHGHPDHIGGLLDKKGCPIYKNAELYLHPQEAEFWTDDNRLQSAGERELRQISLARRTLDAYAEKLRFTDGDEIIEGIQSVCLPGHTPGHIGFQITSDNVTLLIWGDIVHYPYIQTEHPAVSIRFDNNPVQAEETRKKILGQVTKNNWLVAGMHLGEEGFVYIGATAEGYHISNIEEYGH